MSTTRRSSDERRLHRVLAADTSHRPLTTSLFVLVVLVTIGITIWAGKHTRTATDYYASGRSFTGVQNGFAVAGDYMSAASFLGISGAIALTGYDGFLYSIGFLVAWLVALLLIAELTHHDPSLRHRPSVTWTVTIRTQVTDDCCPSGGW